jgi:hypothetical protein
MTQSEAFEANLARGGDSCVVRSKILFNAAVTNTPTAILSLNPLSSLGARQNNIAAAFTDFRIKQVVIKFLCSTSTQFVALGFVDDATSIEGDAPTSTGGVSELRCSGSSLAGVTVPTTFVFRPADTRFWYKTYNSGSGADPRFAIPAVLYASAGPNSTTTQLSLEVDATIVYKGAVDVGAGVHVVIPSSPTAPPAAATTVGGYFRR